MSILTLALASSIAIAQVPHPECKTGGKMRDGVFDCGGITISAEKACTNDAEGQKAIIQLFNATIKNVVIDPKAGGDGIHCREGDCVLENVQWPEICEDAATLDKQGKSMTIIGGSAANSERGVGGPPDKIFQHNSTNSDFIIKDFTITGENGKVWRSCGNCTDNEGPRNLIMNNVRIEGEIDSIAGPNKTYLDIDGKVIPGMSDTVTISNLGIKDYKEGKPKVCVTFTGIKKNNTEGMKDSPKGGEEWDTETCKVSPKDITPL